MTRFLVWRKSAVVRLAAGAVALALLGSGSYRPQPAVAADTKADKKVDFAKDIQPILKESCVKCHQKPDEKTAGGEGEVELLVGQAFLPAMIMAGRNACPTRARFRHAGRGARGHPRHWRSWG